LLVKLSELLPTFGSVVPAGAEIVDVLVTEPVAERLICTVIVYCSVAPGGMVTVSE
jgi:hypothetical protein